MTRIQSRSRGSCFQSVWRAALALEVSRESRRLVNIVFNHNCRIDLNPESWSVEITVTNGVNRLMYNR